MFVFVIIQVILSETGGNGVDRAAEMSGASQVVNSDLWACLRKGGHVVLVGIMKTPIHIENASQNIRKSGVCKSKRATYLM